MLCLYMSFRLVNKAVLLTKMAGFWPSSFFCVFMDGDKVEVHTNGKKKESQYPAILNEQPWSIKGLLYCQKITLKNFAFVGTKLAIRVGERPILPTWVANQNTGFVSSCPLTEQAI